MFCELSFEGFEGDADDGVGVRLVGDEGGVVEEGVGQLVHLPLLELHPVLVHASPHHVLQLFLLDQPVAWNTIQNIWSKASSHF